MSKRKSKYQAKKGRQMYGPGCCANNRTYVEIGGTKEIGGKELPTNKLPLSALPCFTTERTPRLRS